MKKTQFFSWLIREYENSLSYINTYFSEYTQGRRSSVK